MAVTFTERPYATAVHPLHAVLVASTLPTFLGALLSDVAYARTFEIQWNNFASWLIAGGLVLAGLALLAAVIEAIATRRRGRGRGWLYVALLVVLWGVGFLNALMHARDAWAGMPDGLVMSAIVFALACIATWLAFHAPRTAVATASTTAPARGAPRGATT